MNTRFVKNVTHRLLLMAVPGVLLLLSTAGIGSAPSSAPFHANALPAVRASALPSAIHFEANVGQTDSTVKYLARSKGYTLYLTPREAVMALGDGQGAQAGAGSSTVLRTEFVGANQAPALGGLEPLAGYSNYFIGNDPQRWQARVPHFAKIQYTDVYPGIDLIYYSRSGVLQYDFIVAPGADPDSIALNISGAEKIETNAEGSLILQTAHGNVEFGKPLVYQERSGIRREIPSAYAIKESGQVAFQLGAYDRTRTLVIDPPVLVYSTFLGGTDYDYANAVAADNSGSAYVTGGTHSVDFPTKQPLSANPLGKTDIFVSKFTPDGTDLVYSTYIGGAEGDVGYSIAVDKNGNAYLTGYTSSSNFPTVNAFDSSYGSVPTSVAFALQLNADGSAIKYSTFLGGGNTGNVASGSGIAVDTTGKIYVTGFTNSANFPKKNYYQSYQGGDDVFVSKIDPALSGNASLLWSTFLGGGNIDDGNGIALHKDLAGTTYAYITGNTNSSNFPTKNPYQANKGGLRDAFVSVFKQDGTLVFSTFLGGNGNDMGFGIATDPFGGIYVTGMTNSPNFPTTVGAYDTKCGSDGTCNGAADAFVTKLNTAGTLTYSTYLGGANGYEHGRGIAVDKMLRAHVAGSTLSSDFPTKPNAFDTQCGNDGTCNGKEDVFWSVLNKNGSGLVYSTFLGDEKEDTNFGGNVIAVNSLGDVFLTGTTFSPSFPRSELAYDTSCDPIADCWDAFVTKFSVGADVAVTQSDSPDPIHAGNNTNNIVIYTLQVTNHGPADATGIKLTDKLTTKATIKILDVTFDGSIGSCQHNDTNVVCGYAQLPSGAVTEIKVKVKAKAVPTGGDKIVSKADVSANELDPDTTNNHAKEKTTVLDN